MSQLQQPPGWLVVNLAGCSAGGSSKGLPLPSGSVAQAACAGRYLLLLVPPTCPTACLPGPAPTSSALPACPACSYSDDMPDALEYEHVQVGTAMGCAAGLRCCCCCWRWFRRRRLGMLLLCCVLAVAAALSTNF